MRLPKRNLGRTILLALFFASSSSVGFAKPTPRKAIPSVTSPAPKKTATSKPSSEVVAEDENARKFVAIVLKSVKVFYPQTWHYSSTERFVGGGEFYYLYEPQSGSCEFKIEARFPNYKYSYIEFDWSKMRPVEANGNALTFRKGAKLSKPFDDTRNDAIMLLFEDAEIAARFTKAVNVIIKKCAPPDPTAGLGF